jgi:hypothetical protein
MENSLEPIIQYCEQNNLNFRTMPESYKGTYILIEQRNEEISEEKIYLIEVEENVVFRISYTKSQVDIFCKTEKPMLSEEHLKVLEREVTLHLKKEKLKNLF